MTSINNEAPALKSAEAGRVQTPVEPQVELVREFERSGLSGPRFAELAGVKYQTFCHVAAQACAMERAIRPTAIGKKNWLFIGEADAGQRHKMPRFSKIRRRSS